MMGELTEKSDGLGDDSTSSTGTPFHDEILATPPVREARSSQGGLHHIPPFTLDFPPGHQMSNMKESQENNSEWVTGQERELRSRLGLQPIALDSDVDTAWKKHEESTPPPHMTVEDYQKYVSALQAGHPIQMSTPEEQSLSDLMLGHQKRIARHSLGLEPDASEQEILSKMSQLLYKS